MKVITAYQCEICGQRYDTLAEAAFCEAQRARFEGQPPESGTLVIIKEGQGCDEIATVQSALVMPCVAAFSRAEWHTLRLQVAFTWQGHVVRRVLHDGQYELVTG